MGAVAVSGRTTSDAPGIAAASRSWSSTLTIVSLSPQTSVVGWRIEANRVLSSKSNRPSSTSRQTRAGNVRLSSTTRLKKEAGRGSWVVPP